MPELTLFGESMAPEMPSWFTAGKNTPLTHINNVKRGLHPTGHRLSADERTKCGTCKHLRRRGWTRDYLKCGLMKWSCGPATDIRAKWRGCSNYEKV